LSTFHSQRFLGLSCCGISTQEGLLAVRCRFTTLGSTNSDKAEHRCNPAKNSIEPHQRREEVRPVDAIVGVLASPNTIDKDSVDGDLTFPGAKCILILGHREVHHTNKGTANGVPVGPNLAKVAQGVLVLVAKDANQLVREIS